jgi:hypothetical protein
LLDRDVPVTLVDLTTLTSIENSLESLRHPMMVCPLMLEAQA